MLSTLLLRTSKKLARILPTLLTIATFSAATLLPAGAPPAFAQSKNRGTGLPLPRFVSLKSNDVNVRQGPGQEYDVAFTFVKAGLPVEITQEFDTWRKIRDSEGAEGWVFHSLLSGKRTALIAPWETETAGPFAAREDANPATPVVAYLQPKVIAGVDECESGWCRVDAKGSRGWIEQERLWGVYPNEEFKD